MAKLEKDVRKGIEQKRFTIEVKENQFYEMFLRIFNGSIELSEREIHLMIVLDKEFYISRATGEIDLSQDARNKIVDEMNKTMFLYKRKGNVSYPQLSNMILELKKKGILIVKRKKPRGKQYFIADQVRWKDKESLIKILQFKFILKEN